MKKYSYLFLLWFFLLSCAPREAKEKSGELPPLFPDYAFCCVPCNIAPLNFEVKGASYVRADFSLGSTPLATLTGKSTLRIPEKSWSAWLNVGKGRSLTVQVSAWSEQHPAGIAYQPFDIHVAADEIDPWIAYRLIEPGYELWGKMGIYQRSLTSFDEQAIVTNDQNHRGCVNCHSFCNYSPKDLMFHARGKNGGTVIVRDGNPAKVDLSQLPPGWSGAYPMWHPSGRYIAFSANDTHQSFYHYGQTPVEVYDLSSNLMIYDLEKNNVLTDPRFTDTLRMETFPAFSPDGRQLYFCSAPAMPMPMANKELKYALLRVGFDPETGLLASQVDTLYTPQAKGGSASFPRLSPDGRYLLYTEAASATFPIWHKEADLKMIRLTDGKEMETTPLNSTEAESYHVWSSNGRWILFSSRRLDGRYTRLFIAHLDREGRFHKPFLLPQLDPVQNVTRLKSYNLPEFIRGEVSLNPQQITALFD